MFFLIFICVVALFYFIIPYIKRGTVWFIKAYTEIQKDFTDSAIFNAFIRVLRLNWYNYVLLLLVWLLLFLTEVGKDIIDSYLSNLKKLSFGWTFGSYLSLFSCIFIMSLSIWILPFFIYSPKKEKEIKDNFNRFYLSTKIIAFIAMFPFLLITNAFLFFSLNTYENIWLILLINGVSFIAFLGLIYFFTFKFHSFVLLKKFDKFSKNHYVVILIKITSVIIILALLFSCINRFLHRDENLNILSYVVASYIFIASAFVFRLLFYSNESKVDINKLVEKMLSPENKKHSRILYNGLVWSLVIIVLYYYFVPSLEATNPLYVLLFVFSFYVIYFDYWRHILIIEPGLKNCLLFLQFC